MEEVRKTMEQQAQCTRDKLLVELDQMMENLGYIQAEIRRGKMPREKGLFVDDKAYAETLYAALRTQMQTVNLIALIERGKDDKVATR